MVDNAESTLFRIDPDRAQRIAEGRNARAAARMPLLADAGLLEPVSAADVKAAWDRYAQAFEETRQRLQLIGDTFRAACRQLVAAKELQRLDEARSKLPDSEEYHADFWRRTYARIAPPKR
jgi:hypothetical protein